jgi:hypothetical protein
MKFRAILQNQNDQEFPTKNIWLTTKEEAELAGKIGLDMYGGTNYIIEEK